MPIFFFFFFCFYNKKTLLSRKQNKKYMRGWDGRKETADAMGRIRKLGTLVDLHMGGKTSVLDALYQFRDALNWVRKSDDALSVFMGLSCGTYIYIADIS